ncbi:MAG: EI24 domain-containing protein [Variovorax sp.]
MNAVLDAGWRAAVYCLRPRVIALSMAPLVVMLLLGWGLAHFYWEPALAWTRGTLGDWPLLARVWGWLGLGGGGTGVNDVLAKFMLVLGVTPLLVLLSVTVVAGLLSPALTRLVAQRRFPLLERKHGGTLFGGVARSLAATLVAFLALLVSIPLWLIPPLILVLPPLIWGWLTYRVLSFDALAEHASTEERETLLARHRVWLLGIGVVCGYLGTAPSIVWASGLLFAAAFVVLVPIAIWIYMLVFAFSALWYAHYCLDALATLRQRRALVDGTQQPQVLPQLPPAESLTALPSRGVERQP